MTKKIFLKTNRLLLCELQDSDKENIFKIATEAITLRNEEYQKKFNFAYWEEVNSETILNATMFLADSETFVGRICMKYINETIPELGIEILNTYQNKGYGPEAIKAFCKWYANEYNVNEVSVRIKIENTHSIHIFEKLGAKLIGQSSSISDESINIIQNYFSEDISGIWKNDTRDYLLGIPVEDN